MILFTIVFFRIFFEINWKLKTDRKKKKKTNPIRTGNDRRFVCLKYNEKFDDDRVYSDAKTWIVCRISSAQQRSERLSKRLYRCWIIGSQCATYPFRFEDDSSDATLPHSFSLIHSRSFFLSLSPSPLYIFRMKGLKSYWLWEKRVVKRSTLTLCRGDGEDFVIKHPFINTDRVERHGIFRVTKNT